MPPVDHPHLHMSKSKSCNDLVRLLSGANPFSELVMNSNHSTPELREVMRERSLTPSEDFVSAFDEICSQDGVFFVTGKAGTGKSTFIELLREGYPGNVVVLAPTGVAALRCRGQTIHSFFGFPLRPLTAEDVRVGPNFIVQANMDLLAIDEISMVRADLLDAVSTALQIVRRKPGIPFGGIKVVLTGDLCQLPPVVVTEDESRFIADRYESPFFFSAKAFDGTDLRTIELTKIFRQQDRDFVDLLNCVRSGSETQEALQTINSIALGRSLDGKAVTLTCTNRLAQGINSKRLQALPGDSMTFRASSEGQFTIAEQQLPAPRELELKPEAQVMFTRNDADNRWVNGTVGTVLSCTDDAIYVDIEEAKLAGTVEVKRETWSTFRYKYDPVLRAVKAEEVGSYRQFPLMLAWAVTIHKGQGQTFEQVNLNLGNGAFAPGQLYVALSRCRSLEGLSLARPLRESDVINDPQVLDFHRSIGVE
jgi:ATP-dependent DNA helicase PIF1